MDDLGATDEVELGERRDALAVERRLEAEVEALERLDRQELGGAQGHVDPSAFAGHVFLAQQRVDRLDGGDLAALEPLNGMIQSLHRTRHLQPDQRTADPVEKLGHDRTPWAARRLPTAS